MGFMKMDDDVMMLHDEGKPFHSFSKQEGWKQREVKRIAPVFSTVCVKTRALRNHEEVEYWKRTKGLNRSDSPDKFNLNQWAKLNQMGQKNRGLRNTIFSQFP